MKILKKYQAALLLVLGMSFPAVAAENTPVVMLSHKALYNFKMTALESGADLVGMQGQMYFEQDDVCDAWTTDHRFSTESHYAEQPPVINTSHYVAYESKDLQQFSFSSERQENGEMTEQLRGSIEAAADGSVNAVYSRPDDLKYDLPKGYLLPTAHTMEVIRHARAGDRFFNAVVFDGTDAEGPVEINTVIGKKVAADALKKIAAANPKIDATLLTPDAWYVRMAVFPLNNMEDMAPSYEMDMIVHDNGVVSYTLVDYATFKVAQTLTALEKLPPKKCN